MKKRLLCVLLVVLLILSAPFTVFASEENTDSDEGGSSEIVEPGQGEQPDTGDNDDTGNEGGTPPPEPPSVTVDSVNITGISGNQTVSVGETATFSVEATGDELSYTWEMKLTGSAYKTVGSSKSYSVNVDSDKYDGAEVRCKVYNSVSSEYTSVMTITVKEDGEEISISKHPQSMTVDNGEEFILTASAKSSKGDVSYAWYYRKAGETTWRLLSESSAKTNELKMTADSSLDGAVFRCKIIGVDGEVFTNEATITISSKIKIIEQPASRVEVVEGQPLNLVVTANGKNLSYYWYYKSSSDWISTGVRNNSIIIDEVTADMNGRVYRCKVYGDDGEVYTNEITISVLPPVPKITTQSDVKQFVTVGSTLDLFVKAEGEKLKYEWEYMSVDSTEWVSTNVKRSEFSEEIIDMFYDGAQFRCKVKNDSGETISQIITVTVTEAPIVPCDDEAHIFTLWNMLSPATENISGLAARTCEICGYTENNQIPAGTAADVDLELLFSGGIIDSDEEDDNVGGGIDPAMIAIVAMVICAAGLIIILVLRLKKDGSGLFDDDDDDDDDAPDIDAVSSEELSSDTNEFVLPGATESTEVNSVDGESQADKDDEMMTKVIPEIARTEFDDVSDFENTDAKVSEDIDDCESITTVIPVSEIEKMISEADNDSLSEE